jgi:hypothetical protein
VQDGHEQIVMPLAIPVERLAQTAFVVKAALLIDPLGPQVEVLCRTAGYAALPVGVLCGEGDGSGSAA